VSTPAGLRERKKRQTRDAIAAAARELFAARGFDAVTVEEVAEAADVSKKTVFNHFPAKEDLVFAAGEDHRAEVLTAIRERPPGTSIVMPFRDHTAAWLDRIEREPVDTTLAVPRLVRSSQALRDRLFIAWEQEAAVLAPAIAEEAGEEPDAILPTVVARTLAWTHRVIVRAAFTRLLAGEDPRTVAADLRVEARRAYDLVEDGLGGYGAASRSAVTKSASSSAA
jgi:AcrR family transcriptional regulator